MIKITVAFFISLFTLISCDQAKDIEIKKGIIIDPAIKKDVEKNITLSPEFDAAKDMMQIYINTGEIESYENDNLVYKSGFREFKSLFKCFYLWKNDTLLINGAFGLFGGIGFAINIVGDSSKLYHMLSSDDFPTYAYHENDSLIFRLEVPCTDTKIVLSEIPDSTKNTVVYGYVEFKSRDYYSSAGIADGNEILPRKKMRNNMKLYFKSGKLDL